MKKRILSFALALALCLGLSVPAYAAGQYQPWHIKSSIGDYLYQIELSCAWDTSNLYSLKIYDTDRTQIEPFTKADLYYVADGSTINIQERYKGIYSSSVNATLGTGEFTSPYGLNIYLSDEMVTLQDGDTLDSNVFGSYNVLYITSQTLDDGYQRTTCLYLDRETSAQDIPTDNETGTTQNHQEAVGNVESEPNTEDRGDTLGGSYLDSGSTSIDKLSKNEILQLLADNPLTLPDNVFDQVPSCSAPYSTGKVKTSALQTATDRLNALRQIAGLPTVQLDLTLCEQAQYGAVIVAAQGALNHNPSKPSGMDNDFYERAYDATSSSNLYAGQTLTTAVDGFMNDSDASNIDRLGHRRWQLNPGLGKIGFGYAESDTRYRTYVTEKVFDKSGDCEDYKFISWPASGNFPSNLFDGDIAWSVSLNTSEYRTPRQSDLTVTLVRESDGKTWTFRGSGYGATDNGAYFHVDTANYGIPNCIIFRPEGITSYEGKYTVTIDGLKSASGSPVDFSYQVDFFNPDDIGVEPEKPQETTKPEEPDDAQKPDDTQKPGGTTEVVFTDVPSTHWAYPYVTEMASLGVVNGIGNGKFAPDQSISSAEFSTMLANLFFADELAAYQGDPYYWWESYADVLLDAGALYMTTARMYYEKGIWDQEVMEAPITRYDMAQIMYNILNIKDINMPSTAEVQRASKQIADYSSIPETYMEAVTAMYAMGCLTGVDGAGTFSGDGAMTRASACVVLCRLLEKI